jgi:hypothetical protein
VAADGAVGAAEVAGFPGLVQRAEGVGNVLRERLLAVQSFAASALVEVKPYIKSKRRIQRTYGNQCETSR